jgi:hypothetical protein
MKIFLALVIGFASGFALSRFWRADREKQVANAWDVHRLVTVEIASEF